jgi:hypothetical protein
MTNRGHAQTRPAHAVAIALAGAGCALALALAACGSSSKPQGGVSAGFSQAVKFSACMRSHGITNFPDPSSAGGGINIQLNAGINPSSPGFEAAQSACSKLLPGGGPVSAHPTEQAKLQMLHLSQCMRAHGLATFPDPTTTPPNPGASGGGPALALGRGGVFLAIPSSINPQSPAFEQAAAACNFPIPKRTVGPPPS